jgi:hypothetical protein
MGDDGVTKVVSRRLPREDAVAEDTEAPPPFAGIAVEEAEAEEGPALGEAAPAPPAPASRDSAEAA